MGPIAMYSASELGAKEKFKLKWIDEGKDDPEKLRTNPSEDDLCLKETVEPITNHKESHRLVSIIKVPVVDNILNTGL